MNKQIYIILFAFLLLVNIVAAQCIEDSVKKECNINGKKILELYQPRYYDNGFLGFGRGWKTVNTNIVSCGFFESCDYKIDKSIYSLQVTGNNISLTVDGETLTIKVKHGILREVNNNQLIYNISDNKITADLIYTFKDNSIEKLIVLYSLDKKKLTGEFSYDEDISYNVGKLTKFNIDKNVKIWDSSGKKLKRDLELSSSNSKMKMLSTDFNDLTFPIYIDPSLIIPSGTTSLGGNLEYDIVYVAAGATLQINGTGWLNLTATDNMTIAGTINGYNSAGGLVGGGGARSAACSTYGGTGGTGTSQDSRNGGTGGGGGSTQFNTGSGSGGSAASVIGTQTGRYEIGLAYTGGASGGGGGGGASVPASPCQGSISYGSNGNSGSGYGGASIKLSSPDIKINGTVTVNGGAGGDGGAGGSGLYYAGTGGSGGAGASAGEIIIDGTIVNINSATLTANGGSGGSGGASGSGAGGGAGNSGSQGAGGRIKIFYKELFNTSISTSVTGGNIGTVYYENMNTFPSVTLNSPYSNQVFSTTNNVTVNCSATDNDNYVARIDLDINNVTVNTVYGNSTYLENIYNANFSDGYYYYHCHAYDNFNATNVSSSTYAFIVNTAGTSIFVTSPLGTFDYGTVGKQLTLNWTVASPIGLSTCWYNYNNTITYVNCYANSSYFNQSDSSKTQLTFYSNDTLNSISSISTNWNYLIFENSRMANPETITGSSETFSTNITFYDTDFINIDADLIYNNTNYLAAKSISGNNVIFTRTIDTPQVKVNTNFTYYWNISLTNTQLNNIKTSNGSQYSHALFVDNCSNYSTLVYNITLYQEKEKTLMSAPNSSIQITLLLSPAGSLTSNNYIVNFSRSYNNVNPARVCVSTNLSQISYRVDLIIGYSADGYVQEYYYIDNGTLTNSSNPAINLYDLLNSESTSFLVTYQDENYLYIQDAVIDVWRKYVGDGTFISVEHGKTDTGGQTRLHLVTEDVIYKFLVRKNNQLLYESQEYLALCQATPCQINLRKPYESVSTLTDIQNLVYSLDLNQSTNKVTFTFATKDGTPTTINFLVETISLFNTTLCNQTLTTSGGAIICDVPTSYTNKTLLAQVTKDNLYFGYKSFSLSNNPRDIFGSTGIILSAMAFLALALMGISSGIATVVLGIVGLVFVGLLQIFASGNIIGIGSAIVWLIVAGIIIIFKISHRRVS